jgi:hypothetical protein
MHESQPPPIIVSRPVARPRNNFWPGVFAGAVSVAALWLLASFAHFALVEDPAAMRAEAAESQVAKEARLRSEAGAIMDGGLEAWQNGSQEAQQVACYAAVSVSHPQDPPERQKMLGRLIWAQLDYIFPDARGDSFTELFAMIDAMDYQPRLPKSKP